MTAYVLGTNAGIGAACKVLAHRQCCLDVRETEILYIVLASIYCRPVVDLAFIYIVCLLYVDALDGEICIEQCLSLRGNESAYQFSKTKLQLNSEITASSSIVTAHF